MFSVWGQFQRQKSRQKLPDFFKRKFFPSKFDEFVIFYTFQNFDAVVSSFLLTLSLLVSWLKSTTEKLCFDFQSMSQICETVQNFKMVWNSNKSNCFGFWINFNFKIKSHVKKVSSIEFRWIYDFFDFLYFSEFWRGRRFFTSRQLTKVNIWEILFWFRFSVNKPVIKFYFEPFGSVSITIWPLPSKQFHYSILTDMYVRSQDPRATHHPTHQIVLDPEIEFGN